MALSFDPETLAVLGIDEHLIKDAVIYGTVEMDAARRRPSAGKRKRRKEHA